MTNKRRLIYGALILSLLVVGYSVLRRHDKKTDAQITAPVLGPNDQAKVILNPITHTITTVTRRGPVSRTYLPPHVTGVTFGTDGKVTVSVRKWGTEASPFIGVGFADKARVVVGVDLLYWQRWEFGPFLASTVSGPLSVRAGLKVSYNVWNNTSLYVGVDNTKSPTGGISFKF